MQTFYVVFKDALFGISVDAWSDRGAAGRRVRTYYRVTAPSLGRLRRLRRMRIDAVPAFDVWSPERVGLYREWCRAHGPNAWAFPSLDHLETSEPPRRAKVK